MRSSVLGEVLVIKVSNVMRGPSALAKKPAERRSYARRRFREGCFFLARFGRL